MDDQYVYDPENEDCWPELEDVVHEFLRVGCDRIPPTWGHHTGLTSAWERRYTLVNPDDPHRFVTIMMTENELVAPDTIERWERTLDRTIPKPWVTAPPTRRPPWSPPIH